MNIKFFGSVLMMIAAISVLLFNSKVLKSKIESAVSEFRCAGTKYSGAWFDVIVPENFIAKPSMPSTTNDGYDSVWFENSEMGIELYVYSPQWGGKPSDILDDSTVVKQSEHVQSNDESSVHILRVTYPDGKSGSYTSTEKVDYASHLTTGYRSNHEYLSEELEKIYTCFAQSIQQFAD